MEVMKGSIPKEVKSVVAELEKQGFEAYIVGGCVRDMFLGREPQDWDVATSATPEEVQKVFPDNFYENKFFTVTVRTQASDPKLKEIEVTSYRSDLRYGDRRHPEEVQYAKTVEEDLARRDFTVNAIALGIGKPGFPRKPGFQILDPFGGREDLKAKLIRAVGTPDERFQEDALRMMRGVRFCATLGFALEPETRKAIAKNVSLLKEISQERIRDEFAKIIMAEKAGEGVETLRELGLLEFIIPELVEGYGVTQNKHHIYTVWEHNLLSLEYAVKQKWSFEIRLASLLHDVGKPRVKKGEGKDSTFYGHEVVGSRLAKQILSRLKFPQKTIEKIVTLVRYHLFYYNVGEVTEASIRRLVKNVGPENTEELLQVRMADRIGSGVPKAEPYKLRHLRYLIDKVSQDPISAKMLKVKGDDVMSILGITPGPRIGWILDALLAAVLEDPKKNEKDILTQYVKELGGLPEEKLRAISKKAEQERENVEMKRDEMTKEKYWV
ncbi:MAG: HD domain-containing protein [bacterium]|nr:HD domain-containing protein [bacterium]